MKRCKHAGDRVTGKTGPQIENVNGVAEVVGTYAIDECDICEDCGAWFALGPANDAPPEVQVEIRAAYLANANCAEYTQIEWCGWNGDEEHTRGRFDIERDTEWQAGFLASEIEGGYSRYSGADGDCEELESRVRRGAED